jgi:hypothetical protein
LHLGFAINWKKVIPPSQNMVFLGILVNSISETLSVPPDKLSEIKQTALEWTHKQKATKRELQSLIGIINWTAKSVRAVRPIMRIFIEATKKLKRASHHLRLSLRMRNELKYFQTWCDRFNGTVYFPFREPLPDTTLVTDACTIGGAAYMCNDWFYINWSTDFPSLANEHINNKELAVVLIAARRWGPGGNTNMCVC